MPKLKIKETDLAARVVEWLEYNGWKVYKEVSMSGTGGDIRIDILAIKDDIFWGLEAKTSFNFQVMCQANKWSQNLHKVSIIVPIFHLQKKDHQDLRLAASICKDFLDFGLIEVDLRRTKEEFNWRRTPLDITQDEHFYQQTIKVHHDPQPKTPKYHLPKVYEEQLESEAGNNKGEYFTLFKGTIKRINDFLSDKDEYEFGKLIEEVGHHYSNLTSAKSCLGNYVSGKFIPGFELEKRKNKTWIVRTKCQTSSDKICLEE